MSILGDIGGLLGLTGQGSNWQAQGITPEQLNAAIGTTGGAIGQQQALANALAAQGAQGMGSQSALTQALLEQMAGGGPSPAQQALANATGANIANQAALMASQRGAGANAGLLARQAAQQGAGIQQQAAGQGALMRAQERLAAQNALQNLAGNQIGQQAGAVGNLNQFALQNQGQMMNMMAGQNAANQAMQQAAMKQGGGVIGGLLNAAGGALAGPIGNLFSGSGTSGFEMPEMGSSFRGAGQSSALGSSADLTPASMGSQYAQSPKTSKSLGGNYSFAQGGQVPDSINAIHDIYHGGMYQPKMSNYEMGGSVPGAPKVNYDSEKNDVVDAKLSPGEIVLPLSVTKSEDPVNEAAKFVAAILAKKGNPKMEESEFKTALKEAIKTRKK